MIKERSDFFQNAKFFLILNIYNSPDDQCVQICMNSKFLSVLQPVIKKTRSDQFTGKATFRSNVFTAAATPYAAVILTPTEANLSLKKANWSSAI